MVRGGAALVYLGEYESATPNKVNLGFSLSTDFVSPDNGLTPALQLKSGLPPLVIPTETDRRPGFGAVPFGQLPTQPSISSSPTRRIGYMETVNLNIQRQITPNLVLELGYLGTLGHKLPVTGNMTIDQVPINLMGPGNAQIRRPFPQFSDVARGGGRWATPITTV